MREKVDHLFVSNGMGLIKPWPGNYKTPSTHAEIGFHDLGTNPVRPFFLRVEDIPETIKFLEQFIPKPEYPRGTFIAIDLQDKMREHANIADPDYFRGMTFKLVVIRGSIRKELLDVLSGCCSLNGNLVMDKSAVVF